MALPVSRDFATGTPQLSPDIASRKRAADEDATAESTAAKKAAMSVRGQLTMRRSGTPASFHGPVRPSTAAGQSSPLVERATHSRPGSGPGSGPLSLLTPAKFNIPAAQLSTTRGQTLSPSSSSVSSLSSAPTSIANFQLPTEVRQSLSRTFPEASDSTSRLSLASKPVVTRAPQKFIPQFGPAHRMPPESDDESQHSNYETQAVAHATDKCLTFGDRLSKAQEQSEVWNYIKDRLSVVNFTCKTDHERQALLEIMQLPKQNDLDDDPMMRRMDRHKRRYCVVMGSILQVVGVKGHCNACSPHNRKNWEHRKKTCISLPPEAISPKYRELVDFVANRCSNCIRSGYPSASCHFAAGDAPADAHADAEVGKISRAAAADSTPDNASSQYRDLKAPARQTPSQPATLGPNPQAGTATASRENGASDDAEAIIRDAILVGFRASTQLQLQEQPGFHDWLTALLSFSSSSPGLEDQALATFARLRQLGPDAQADIRRRILQMLPGAMGRPK